MDFRKAKVVIIGYDDKTQILVNLLKLEGYSVYLLSTSKQVFFIEQAVPISEGKLFKQLGSFEFAIRSRGVEALNPHVIMLREVIPVLNPISFFLDQFGCRSVFLNSGKTLEKSLISFLKKSGLSVFSWEGDKGIWASGKKISSNFIMVVQVFPEDLVDMYSRPDILMVDLLLESTEGLVVANYIRTQALMAQMKTISFNVIGEYGDCMEKLRSEYPSFVSHFSVRDRKADFIINREYLISNVNMKKCLVKSFSNEVFSPVSERILLQIFAVSNLRKYKEWVRCLLK